MDEVAFIGLDGEMSGTDPGRHQLIQIGVSLSLTSYFESNIGWQSFEFEREALDAIGRCVSSVRAGPSAAQVDALLVEWMRLHGMADRKVVPVGWGVSYFDRPFIARALPRFSAMLHHHSVELNAVAYALGTTRSYLSRAVGFEGWKRMAKKIALLQILNTRGTAPNVHDAGDDAIAALLAWHWMTRVIESGE